GRQQAMSIPRGQSASAFGYTFTYQGMYEPPAGANEHSAMILDVARGGMKAQLRPPLFISKVGEGGVMAWPRILHQWWGDLYVEPNGQDRGMVDLGSANRGGSSTPMPVTLPDGQTDMVTVRFHDFKVDHEALAAMQGGDMPPLEVGGVIDVSINGET